MKTMRQRSWLLLLLALTLLAAACGGGDDGASEDTGEAAEGTEAETTGGATEGGGTAVEGGTVVFGLDQEPAILNPYLPDGNVVATSTVMIAQLYPLWRITPEFEYEPLLLENAEVTSEDPFTVTYTLRDDITWSDGEAITAEDVVFTQETILNEEFDITSRAGHDEVQSTNIIDEQTVEFVFQRTYAPWRTLFSVASGAILPQHVLEGADFNSVWNDGPVNPETGEPIASGPFIFEEWQKGQTITISANENWWGEGPQLDEIVFRPLEDTNTMIQQFRGGELDMMNPQPQLELLNQIEGQEGLTFETAAGPQWEHMDFNFESAPLGQQYVREAIAKGINRQEIVESLINPIDESTEVLNNVIYLNNQEEYEDHWSEVIGYDPEAARSLLEENGCTEGEGGIYECNGERLEFDFTTTAGNELRELTFQVIQQQLQEIGVQVNAAFGESAVVFGEQLVNQDYDLFLFAWVGSPDPAGGDTIWQCQETTGEASLNYTGLCEPRVDQLIQQQLETVDPVERAGLYNEADALIAEAVPVVPLYQKPAFLAWNTAIQGPVINTTQWGATWNVEEWTLTE